MENKTAQDASKKKLPFASVVVITFNRGILIDACLQSLTKQTYPKDRYEIIVVDDGSTDNTVQIAERQSVRVVRHEVNKGIPTARNTGLAAAKGDIIAYIDDDAVADRRWLEYLMQPFSSVDVSVSGGQTFAFKTDYISERYLSAVGYGNPAPLAFGKNKNPLWRFLVYLKGMFVPVTNATTSIEVQAVFGLNCAFRTSVLRAVGGFDETMLADEDSEICTRLREKGAHIIFTPNAIIHHRHRESLKRLIVQTYTRAEYTLLHYAKEKKFLPIFPFPVLYIIAAIILLILRPVVGVIFVVLGPIVIYGWWVMRAFQERHLEYITYGYIQLALELAAIVGLARGKFHQILS